MNISLNQKDEQPAEEIYSIREDLPPVSSGAAELDDKNPQTPSEKLEEGLKKACGTETHKNAAKLAILQSERAIQGFADAETRLPDKEPNKPKTPDDQLYDALP